jgi:hypothetical protein
LTEKDTRLISRRQALISISAFTVGAMIMPRSVLGIESVKNWIKFAVIGDWGSGEEGQYRIAKQMLSAHLLEPLDFVITVGDNIYPDGGSRHFNSKFERPFEKLLNERISFYAALGNHDVKDGRLDQSQYPLFNMNRRHYYTIKKGDGLAEFFIIDSNDLGSDQLEWLENALRSSTARWKIAVFHHPIYSSGKSHGSDLSLRKKLEPLFTRFKVHAAFSGHDHIYERVKPQLGVQYFVTGAAGKIRQGDTDLKNEFRALSYDDSCHFMLVKITGNRIAYQAVSQAGIVIDSGDIKQFSLL